MNKINELIKALGPKVRANEPFKNHTSLKIGGPIALFTEASSEKDLIYYVGLAKKHGVAFLLVGEGSNLLVHEDGFKGFIIQNKIKGIKVKGTKALVKLGTNLQEFVDFLAKKGLSGMERMSGIAGNVGGAVFGNAGAYGQTISDHLKRVKVFKNGKVRWVNKKDCGFEYRESVFKKSGDILLEAEFEFKRGEAKELQKKGADIIKVREEKYKPGLRCPGSFFKNVEVKNLARGSLDKIPEDKIMYGKVPAGYLLETVGAKGAKKGKIKIAGHHANLFINTDGGKATDFFELAEKYKKKVKKKFGIDLEPEVQLIGFDNKVAVLGLGVEGKDLVSFLQKGGKNITVFDQKKKEDIDFRSITTKNLSFSNGKNYLSTGLSDFDVIYRSPGVYRYLPEIVEAEEKGTEISSATKLFFNLCPGKIIGVTGTKGKGTTASLIYQILKKDKKDVYLAGNIGKPFLGLLPKLTKNSWVILELSSFQLIDMKLSPHISVVLNITVDHLDWHKDIGEYVEAKKNIVKHQKTSDFAVINEEYESSKKFSKETEAQVVFFSKGSLEKKLKQNLKLRGTHNLENISAAVSVVRILKVDNETIKEAVGNFKGLEHRLEFSGEKGGVSFYNDSLATGPQPTIAAINAFEEPTTLILGGYDKGLNYKEMYNTLANKISIKTIVLIGDLADRFESALEEVGFRGRMINLGKSEMEEIVKTAKKETPEGGVVLLSPAAASFDTFRDYKDRGKQFKKAVRNLL